MKVYAPYAVRNPLLESLLVDEGLVWMPVFTSPADPEAYWWLLNQVWSSGEDFAIVEHDVLPWPGAMASLRDCPSQWCGFPYRLGTAYSPALGCTKFAGSLTRQCPDLVFGFDRAWHGLDGQIARDLPKRVPGVELHQHWPPVIHTNPAYLFYPTPA